LNVEYEDLKVQELFEDLNDTKNSKNKMKMEIGFEMTKAIKKKYNQIIAFSLFSNLVESKIGKIELLSGDKEGYYSLHISANYRIIIAPKAQGRSAEELKKCDTIIIKGVIDYHGKGKNNWIIP